MDLAHELSALAAHVELARDAGAAPRARAARARAAAARPRRAALAFARVARARRRVRRAAVARRDPALLPSRRRHDRARRPLPPRGGAPARRRHRPGRQRSPRRSTRSAARCSSRSSPPPQAPPRRSSNVVSIVFAYRGRPVLLTRVRARRRLPEEVRRPSARPSRAPASTARPGSGSRARRHDFIFPGPRRGSQANVLSGSASDTTYRLEGRSLSQADAVALARSLTRR